MRRFNLYLSKRYKWQLQFNAKSTRDRLTHLLFRMKSLGVHTISNHNFLEYLNLYLHVST